MEAHGCWMAVPVANEKKDDYASGTLQLIEGSGFARCMELI